MLPEKSPDDRYVIRYSNAVERIYLQLLFRKAVENVDREKKQMIVDMDYQTVRAMTHVGHDVRPAPAQPAG